MELEFVTGKLVDKRVSVLLFVYSLMCAIFVPPRGEVSTLPREGTLNKGVETMLNSGLPGVNPVALQAVLVPDMTTLLMLQPLIAFAFAAPV